ncbi:hypothetical protein D3C72_1571050 [compost metagenome]
MVRAGKRGAGERNERQLGARRMRLRGLHRLLQRAALGHGHRGLAFVGLEQYRQLVVLPILDHQVGPGVDHARATHHKRPHQRDDAQQVVQVQPLHARGPVTPHIAKRQLAHERRIQHPPGDDGHQQQQTHEPEEQLARQPCKQVHVQAEHHIHEAFVHGAARQHFGGARIHGNRLEILGGRRCGRQGDEPHIGIVVGL